MLNNFVAIAHLDTMPVMGRLFRLNPATWKGIPERGETGNPLIGLGASVLLRGHEGLTHENWLDDLPVKDVGELNDWPSMALLMEQARGAVMATDLGKRYLSGIPGRAMLSVLRPGSTIFWHVDDGPYHEKNVRFHIPLVTNPGCLAYAGPESVHMPVGSLFYFNNRVRHSAANWGDTDRIHLIFEMRKTEAANE